MLPGTFGPRGTRVRTEIPAPDVPAPDERQQLPPKRQRRSHGRPTLHDAIAQTGYVPNRQAGQLASGHSKVVAALIPNIGHELLLASTGYSMEREEAQLRALIGWAPGALIVTGRHHTAGAQRLLEQAQAAGTPGIEIWDHAPRRSSAKGFAQIGFDHDAVGRAMARHLLEQGHTALAYVGSGIAEDFRAHERGEGFANEAHAAGARVVTVRAETGDAFDAGRLMFDQLRTPSRHPVTAAAFANDHLACGALMQAQACGLSVPGELAVLGFGDFPLGRQRRPALSTVRPPRASTVAGR